MSPPTTGALAIWHDVEADAAALADLFEWYNRQHHLERLGVPGFVRARRYEAIGDGPRVFSRYDVETPAVLESAAYRERLQNPTGWTRRCMPLYRNMARTVCRVAGRFGRGEGGKLAALRLDHERGAERALARWILEDAFPLVEALPGIVGGQLLVASGEPAADASEEMRMRGAPDARDAMALLITGSSAAAVAEAAKRLAAPEGLPAHGAGSLREGLYELVFDAWSTT